MNTSENHIPFITSKDNDFFKKIKSYTQAKNCKRDGVVLVEGIKNFNEASEHLKLRHALINEDFQPDLRSNIEVSGYVRLSNHLFTSLSDAKNPQGIIGIFDTPTNTCDLALYRKVVLLEGVQDPGNIGTIIRTAFFLGYQAVLLDEACATPFSSKVIRSSMGAVFHLPCVVAPITRHLEDTKAAHFSIIGGDLNGENLRDEDKSNLPDKIALLLGSEGQGLSERALSSCDYRFKIPSENEDAESLNVAIAAGIMMYEL